MTWGLGRSRLGGGLLFPENIAVFVEPYEPVVNQLGSPRDAWGVSVLKLVYGVAPPSSDQPVRVTDTGLKIVLDVYASSWGFVPKSKVTVGGKTYLQEGYPDDFGMGPFGYRPGVRVNLTRIEG